MKINEVTDITRATPQNREHHPASKIEGLVDDLREEEVDDEKVVEEEKTTK